jgi:hypothetical protein
MQKLKIGFLGYFCKKLRTRLAEEHAAHVASELRWLEESAAYEAALASGARQLLQGAREMATEQRAALAAQKPLWEPGSTPRDCLTENHMVLLRSLEGEERREAVRRIKRSRKAFLQVDNAISECLPSLEGSSFSSRDSASIAEKATSPKSVRMLRRSSWSGPSGSAAVCGGQGPVCVRQWLLHRAVPGRAPQHPHAFCRGYCPCKAC